ncbi:LANO_0G17502g1_1 [Lachancea nothofagi CBS 11611]|uniref:LANO_0G17502g1_1 n=1 Tax=Lachancea nothofagi CBS 11611 TaxID=1266666 RepID=A0A1G4KKN8_9SACH|nr:LANO_0G17502g1_1 [Lachancea nothofagi CBS 11611]
MPEIEVVSNQRSKSVQHVKSYPLVKQTHEFIAQLPATRVFVANTKPVYDSVANSKPAQWVSPVTRMVDSVADKGLEVTDKWIPFLKTKTYKDLRQDASTPFIYTKNAVVQASNATVEAADTYVYEPTHNQVIKFRQFYNAKVYDTHGKPLLRSSMDPVVGPYNQKLETMTKSYFPTGKEVATNGFNSEISRTLALTSNLLERMSPVAQQKLVNFVMAPCTYTQHVNNVFNHNLDKQENLGPANSWNASKNAVSTLNQETLEYVNNARNRTADVVNEADVPVVAA